MHCIKKCKSQTLISNACENSFSKSFHILLTKKNKTRKIFFPAGLHSAVKLEAVQKKVKKNCTEEQEFSLRIKKEFSLFLK